MRSAFRKPASITAIVIPCPRNPLSWSFTPPTISSCGCATPWEACIEVSRCSISLWYLGRGGFATMESGDTHTILTSLTKGNWERRPVASPSFVRTTMVLLQRLRLTTFIPGSFSTSSTYCCATGTSSVSTLIPCRRRLSSAFAERNDSGLLIM